MLSQGAWQGAALCTGQMVVFHQNTELRLPENHTISSMNDHLSVGTGPGQLNYITVMVLGASL